MGGHPTMSNPIWCRFPPKQFHQDLVCPNIYVLPIKMKIFRGSTRGLACFVRFSCLARLCEIGNLHFMCHGRRIRPVISSFAHYRRPHDDYSGLAVVLYGHEELCL